MNNFKFKLWDSTGNAITKCKGDMGKIKKEFEEVMRKFK